MANRRRGARDRRPSTPDEPKAGIECTHGSDDGRRECIVSLGLVVERAMRLDVTDDGAFGSYDDVERAKLTDQEILDVLSGQLHWTPAKALPIVITRMRAHGDAVPLGEGDGRPHGVRVAGVESAGHIGRRHQREQGLVGFGITLTNIRVQVDLPHGLMVGRLMKRWGIG